MSSLPRLTRLGAILSLLYAIAGCGAKSEAPAAPPLAEVSVITVKPASLGITNEFPAVSNPAAFPKCAHVFPASC